MLDIDDLLSTDTITSRLFSFFFILLANYRCQSITESVIINLQSETVTKIVEFDATVLTL